MKKILGLQAPMELTPVATNIYLRKTLEKPKRGLQILKRKVWELFTHREGISTPSACHKGRQPLIECVKCDFKIIYFPFFIFIIFLNRQGCFPCSYISPGAIRKSDLHSSLSLNVCVLTWLYVFERFILIANKESLRNWTMKWRFKFWKAERIIKALDLETISSDIWWK